MSHESLSILHVEDNAPDAMLVSAHLDDAGIAHTVERVDNERDFRGALGASSFDIILSDYNLPGFSGHGALQIAREQAPNVPFLFVSGAIGEERAIALLKEGATDYVLKERLERLVPAIERARGEARERHERLRAEVKLREREQTLSTLLGNLPGMAFRCSATPPQRFAFVSLGCQELTGYACEELMDGRIEWGAVVHDDDRARVERERQAAAESQVTLTYRIRTRTGAERWVWERSITRGGIIEGFATDITQQKLAEAEAARHAEFEQHLLGIVSHDLRNPLHTIALAAKVALRREELDPRTTQAFVRIGSAVERATRLIHDLLDFTQARVGHGIPIDPKPDRLDEIVDRVIEEMALEASRIVVKHEVGNLEGEWDADRIAQVVTNLVGNALRHSPEGAPVTVRTVDDGDIVVLDVHNLGEPIGADLRARLFEPMQRGTHKVDRVTRSVGLGLYIVDQIVRRHGGEVDVHSSAVEGTTFRVRLPRRASVRRTRDTIGGT